jgi:hypothetical protein
MSTLASIAESTGRSGRGFLVDRTSPFVETFFDSLGGMEYSWKEYGMLPIDARALVDSCLVSHPSRCGARGLRHFDRRYMPIREGDVAEDSRQERTLGRLYRI